MRYPGKQHKQMRLPSAIGAGVLWKAFDTSMATLEVQASSKKKFANGTEASQVKSNRRVRLKGFQVAATKQGHIRVGDAKLSIARGTAGMTACNMLSGSQRSAVTSKVSSSQRTAARWPVSIN